MQWIRAIDVDLSHDLSALVVFLQQRQIPHRISEEQGRQVVWVLDEVSVAPLREFVEELISGSIKINISPVNPAAKHAAPGQAVDKILLSLLRSPATALLLILSLLGYAAVELHLIGIRSALFFLQIEDGKPLTLSDTLAHGHIWRLVTPIFIHFGIFHIVFNALWLWDLGRRIEQLHGARAYLSGVILMAALSNTVQYLWGGDAHFGGMSGVIYGFVGYIWMRQRFSPHPLLNIPQGIIIFMLVWLLLGMSGIIDFFMSGGGIANGAHLGGLVAGMLLGLLDSDLLKRNSGNIK